MESDDCPFLTNLRQVREYQRDKSEQTVAVVASGYVHVCDASGNAVCGGLE